MQKEREQKFKKKFEERMKTISYDSSKYQSKFYEQTIDRIEKNKWDQEEKQRQRREVQRMMREYQQHVQHNHLPQISLKKKMELEKIKDNLSAEKRKPVPENAPVYSVNSYKADRANSKSVDWKKYKNPFLKEEKPKPEFVRVDYLRFENKKEYLQAKSSKSFKEKLTLKNKDSNKSLPYSNYSYNARLM